MTDKTVYREWASRAKAQGKWETKLAWRISRTLREHGKLKIRSEDFQESLSISPQRADVEIQLQMSFLEQLGEFVTTLIWNLDISTWFMIHHWKTYWPRKLGWFELLPVFDTRFNPLVYEPHILTEGSGYMGMSVLDLEGAVWDYLGYQGLVISRDVVEFDTEGEILG